MKKTCHKAQQDKVDAVYLLGQLIIWARGQKPTRCHEVRIEQWPFRIYPPQYQIVACVDEGVVCPQILANYQTASVFNISAETFEAMQGIAVVHHRGGAERVPVKTIELPEEQTRLLAPGEATDGSGVPSPFALSSGDLPFPFMLSKLFETGRSEDIKFLSRSDVGLHNATGYSNSFSFTEAFQNAVSNLPPDAHPYPDKLINVRVLSVGANYGGIAGLDRLYVTVASFY